MRDDDYLWDKSGPADPEVERLEQVLGGFRAPMAPQRRAKPFFAAALGGGFALAAAAAVIVLFLRREEPATPSLPGWKVDSLAGAPRCGDSPCAELRPGEWLETRGDDRARVEVADIGEMEVAPDSRLRLVSTSADGHSLELERGSISASVVAPPRLLIVDTPVIAAVDLGCAYTLSVELDGSTRIEVTSGWVALEGPRAATYVPAGAVAYAHRPTGPGLPVFTDASPLFRAAAARLDRGFDSAAVTTFLAEARVEDALTVWHLIPRVESADRGRVVARLATLAPPPAGVTTEDATALRPTALEAWREHL
jgi:hypothetical protein